eukprot:2822583-Pyramimonas_sp.AAC.1
MLAFAQFRADDGPRRSKIGIAPGAPKRPPIWPSRRPRSASPTCIPKGFYNGRGNAWSMVL